LISELFFGDGLMSIIKPAAYSFLAIQLALAGQEAPPAPPGGLNAQVIPRSGTAELTATDADQFQARLASQPDDQHAREGMLRYYFQQNDGAGFLNQVQWLLENQPDSTVLDWAVPAFPNSQDANNSLREQLGSLLEQSAATRSDSA
jgi:hypothetical protein